jgi:hypothetical protein
MTDESFEPTRFAWIRDGLLVAGDLNDWAKMWEGDYYAGEHDLTQTLLTWDGSVQGARYHQVEVRREGMTEDDDIPYTITVPGLHDIAIVTIDGRA